MQVWVEVDVDLDGPAAGFLVWEKGWWVDGEEGDGAQAVDVDALTQVQLVHGRLPSRGGPAHRGDPLMTLRA